MTPRETAFRDLVLRYHSLVLVANSEATDLKALKAAYPEDTLFMFFGMVQKIMTRPFDRPSVLCHRLHLDGSIVHTAKDISIALNLFRSDCLIGRVGVFSPRVAEVKANDNPEDFAPQELNYTVDGDDLLHGWYSLGQSATTGFVMALWCARNLPEVQTILAGFTGVRGARLQMLEQHDWVLEQAALRLEYRAGRLRRFEDMAGSEAYNALDQLAILYPNSDPAELSAVYASVLSDRISNGDKLLRLLLRAKRGRQRLDKILSTFRIIHR